MDSALPVPAAASSTNMIATSGSGSLGRHCPSGSGASTARWDITGMILRASEMTPNIWIFGVFFEMEHRVNPPREPRFQLSRKPFNSTSTFLYLTGADRTEGSVNAASARTVRFMTERMMMLANICLMKKIRVGVITMRSGLQTKGSQDHGHAIQERQGSMLTNQCLGKETNAERGVEESFHGQRPTYIVERH